nr:MAG: hypothetical protein E4H34_01715 [Hyphomicrobiales bacterium]
MYFKTQTFAGLALLLLAAPAFGHHSFAMFDQTKTMHVSGTVADYNWMNPHTWLHVAVTDGQGISVTWSFEASSTGRLSASGWSPDMVAVGDPIEVEFNPLRDGTPGGQVRTLHLSNGTELCNGAECRERLGLPE